MITRTFALFVTTLFALVCPALAGPYDAWAKYREVTVNTTAGGANVPDAVADFPLLVRLTSSNAADVLDEAGTGGASLRFASENGETPYSYQIERWTAGTAAEIWVLVPSIAGGNAEAAKLRMYWGNDTTDASNGAAVFSTSNGFQAVFHMNEAAGDTIRDATSNGFKGAPVVGAGGGSAPPSPVNSTTSGQYISGAHRDFPGGSGTNNTVGGGYRLLTSAGGNTATGLLSFTHTGTNVYTISTWINVDNFASSGTSRRGIITKTNTNLAGNPPTNAQWRLRTLNGTNAFEYADNNTNDSSHIVLATNGPVTQVTTAQWSYLTFVRTAVTAPPSPSANIYLHNANGRFRDRFVDSGYTPAKPMNAAQQAGVNVFIGGFAGSNTATTAPGTGFFDGKLDEVTFSNVARDTNWIKLSYETQKPGATPAVTLGSTQEQEAGPTVPGAPTGVVGTAGDGQVSVAFTAPENDGGAAITSYTVTSDPGDFTGTGAASPIIVSGLANGTPYTFTVKATNSEGPGAASSPSSAVTPTPAATVPGAPTDVAGTAGNASVSVSFTAPASDGGAAITSYTATSNPNGFSNTGAASPIVVSGLANGTAYTFTVTATNSVGEGDASAPSASVTPRTVPGAPTNVAGVAGAPGTGQVSVTWDAPGSTGGSAITAYTVTAATSPGGVPSGTCGWTTGPLTCTVGSLAGGSSYTFTAVAANIAGPGASSSPSSAVLVPEGGGSPYASWAKYRDISVNTSAASVAGAVTNYPLLVRLTTANAADVLSDDATGASVRFSSPDGETAYPYEIERWTGTNAEVWVLAPSIAGGTNAVALRMYWGSDTTSASNSAAVFSPANGFLAVWHMNQTTSTVGNTITDATGNGRTGTLAHVTGDGTAPPTDITTAIGVGKSFSGSGGTAIKTNGAYYTVSDPGNTLALTTSTSTTSQPFTISAWANPLMCHGTARIAIVSKFENVQTNTQRRGWSLQTQNSSGAWTTTMDPATYSIPSASTQSVTPVEFISDNTCTAGAWTYVVGRYIDSLQLGTNANTPANNQHNNLKTFINGVVAGSSATATHQARAVGQTADVFIGRLHNADRFFRGGMDEVRIANVARSADWIRLDHQTQVSGSTIVTLGSTQEQGGGPTAPGAPTNVAGTAGNASVTVTWDAPASDGGSAITAYTVSAATSPGGVASGTPCGWTTGPLTCAVTGLTNGQAYTFTVTATNGVGTGAASTASSAVTPRTVPGAPTNVAGTAGDASVTVTWDAPASDGGSAITAYTVSAATSPGGVASGTPCGWTTGPLTCAVTGLTNGQAYTFTAVATNIAGPGAASAPSSAVTPTPAATVPGAPTNVAGTAGNASVTVTWDAPASDGGSAITAYTVSAATSPGGVASGTPCGWTTGPLTCAVTGLTNGQAYTFTATAANAVGTGNASAASSAVTPRTVPGAPTNVAGTAGNASVTVTWNAPASDGGSAITAYTVSAATSPGGVASGTPCGWTTGPLTCAVTGLTNGQAYTFTAVATNIAGPGAASAPSSAVTPRTVPGAPQNVAGTPGAPGTGQVAVTWNAPASDGGSTITAYTVTAATSPGGVASGTCGWTTGPLTCTVGSLTGGSSYTFTAVAANVAGAGTASAASAPVQVPVNVLPGSRVFRVTGAEKPYAFALPGGTGAETATLRITDLWGRTVWSGSVRLGPEATSLEWNGRASNGRLASAGLYVARLVVAGGDKTTEQIRKAATLKPE